MRSAKGVTKGVNGECEWRAVQILTRISEKSTTNSDLGDHKCENTNEYALKKLIYFTTGESPVYYGMCFIPHGDAQFQGPLLRGVLLRIQH